jgi:hypothetical protein
MGTLHEDIHTSMIAPQWILLKMKKVSDNICRGNQNAHCMFNNFFSKNCAFLR